MTEPVDKARLDAEVLRYLQAYGHDGGRGGVTATRINSDIEYTVAGCEIGKSLGRLKKLNLVTNLYRRGHRWYASDIFTQKR